MGALMKNTHMQIKRYHDVAVALGSSERGEMKSRRNTNRERLKNGLANAGNPKPVGCHTQGSYAMHTMIQDSSCDYDIDDGVYFKAEELVGSHGAELTPLAVRKMVCDALQDDKFSNPPETLKNCVRVYYNQGYHVDVPAYRRFEKVNAWNGKTEYFYELASSSWKASDPKAVTDWFRKTNNDLSPDVGIGQFRRIVRCIKMFSKSRSSWKGKNPSGFALTKLASEHAVMRLNRDDQALRETLRGICTRLVYDKSVRHPVITDEFLLTSDDARSSHFLNRLEENLKHLEVLDDVDCTHEKAMAAWDKFFNTDWFSEQPDEDDGNNDAPKSPVDKRAGGTFA